MIGNFLDAGVFLAAVPVVAALFGAEITVNEMAAVMTGLGALSVGIGRAVKYFADAWHSVHEAKVLATYTDPEVFEKLKDLKCYNAPECIDRALFPEEAGPGKRFRTKRREDG